MPKILAALLAAWVLVWIAIFALARDYCNIGSNTTECGPVDTALFSLGYLLIPATIVAVAGVFAAMILLRWMSRR